MRRSWYHVLGEPLRFPSRVGDEPRSTDDGVDESSLSSALLLWKRQLAQVMGMNMGDSRDEPRSMDDGVDESSLSSALMLWKRQLTQVMGMNRGDSWHRNNILYLVLIYSTTLVYTPLHQDQRQWLPPYLR